MFKRQDIDEANAKITDLEGQLTAKGEEISTLAGQLSAKDAEIANLKIEAAGKEGQITTLKESLTAKETEVTTLKKDLTDEKAAGPSRVRQALANAGVDPAILKGEDHVPEVVDWAATYAAETDPVKKAAIWKAHEADILT